MLHLAFKPGDVAFLVPIRWWEEDDPEIVEIVEDNPTSGWASAKFEHEAVPQAVHRNRLFSERGYAVLYIQGLRMIQTARFADDTNRLTDDILRTQYTEAVADETIERHT